MTDSRDIFAEQCDRNAERFGGFTLYPGGLPGLWPSFPGDSILNSFPKPAEPDLAPELIASESTGRWPEADDDPQPIDDAPLWEG